MESGPDPTAASLIDDQLITQTQTQMAEYKAPTHITGGGALDHSEAAGVPASPPMALDITLATQATYCERPVRAASMSTANWTCPGSRLVARRERETCLEALPNEILFHIFEHLDVCDLLAASRTNHHLRCISLAPLLHVYRLRRNRTILPPLLTSPTRPSLSDLQSRHIFLTHTSVVSRRLARSLVSIRLSRRLAVRPSAEALVQRAVLPQECVPGMASVHVSPALVAKKKAVEKERLKDGLRRWVEGKWRGEVREREECVRQRDESHGVGRVWRLRRFWERVSRGEQVVVM